MSSTSLTIAPQHLPASYEEFARCLSNNTYASEVITQEQGAAAQFALAMTHLSFALTLIARGFASLPSDINRAAIRRLARIPRTTLLAASTSGLIGWGWAFVLTVLFIWR